jgi:hypothetical protein
LVWNSCKSDSNCIATVCPFLKAKTNIASDMDSQTSFGTKTKDSVAKVIESMLEMKKELERRLIEVEVTLDRVLSVLPIPSKNPEDSGF